MHLLEGRVKWCLHKSIIGKDSNVYCWFLLYFAAVVFKQKFWQYLVQLHFMEGKVKSIFVVCSVYTFKDIWRLVVHFGTVVDTTNVCVFPIPKCIYWGAKSNVVCIKVKCAITVQYVSKGHTFKDIWPTCFIFCNSFLCVFNFQMYLLEGKVNGSYVQWRVCFICIPQT